MSSVSFYKMAEDILSQAIRELRRIINTLHSASPEPDMHER
jgi:hypothetical protein